MPGGARQKVSGPARKKGLGGGEGWGGKADLKGPEAVLLLPGDGREAALTPAKPAATTLLVFVPTKLIFIKNSERCLANKGSAT